MSDPQTPYTAPGDNPQANPGQSSDPGSEALGSLAELQARLAELQAQNTDLADQFLRAKARSEEHTSELQSH